MGELTQPSSLSKRDDFEQKSLTYSDLTDFLY